MRQRVDEGRTARAAKAITAGALLAVAGVAHGCKDIVAETILPVADAGSGVAQVGDPCIPADEVSAAFSGFGVGAVNIENEFNACASGICLVNHFQGRVTCPLGQAEPPECAGGGTCPAMSCQTAAGSAADNAGKSCCAEGSNTGVSSTVCGQCSERTAADAVYCSCPCGAADGAPADAGPYCDCPDGFSCAQLEPYLPLGGPGDLFAAKYCIKQGTEYTSSTSCGTACGGP